MEKVWQEVKSKLKESLTKGQYDFWVSNIDFLGIASECLRLGCRNRFHIEWLREKLEEKLLGIVRQYFPEVRRLEYQIVSYDETQVPEEETNRPQQVTFGDLVKRSGPLLNPRFTFDQFVVGKCNQFAHAAAMAMAGAQTISNQSLYLLSDPGLGKSHLTHAVGNQLCVEKPDLRVQYVTTEQFTNEMIFALKNGRIEAFKDKFRSNCDILLLEKVEFLSGKEKVQSELVYTLDELMDRGKKLVCTGSSFPRDIPKLSTELQSRLGGIMVAPLERPDFGTRIEIIKRKARNENVQIPTKVIEYLADQITGDVRQLESCLVGLITKTNILQIPASLELAHEVTRTMLDFLPKITVDHIIQVVCSSFNIDPGELKSPSRRKDLAVARKIGMYLCRKYTSESLTSIGRSFKRNHSTVMYAVNDLTKEISEKNGKLKRQLDHVIRRLETSCLSE